MNDWVLQLNHVADIWAQTMWRACWKGAVAIAVVAGLCWLFRRSSPAVRCWLWRLAYVKLILLLAWNTPIELPLLPRAPETAIAPGQNLNRDEPAINDTGVAAVGLTESPSSSSEVAAIPEPAGMTLAGALFLGWIAGVVCAIARISGERRRAVRLRHRGKPAGDKSLVDRAGQLCAQFGVRRRPDVLLLDDNGDPSVVGVLRPAILIPSSLVRSLSHSELDLILAHEIVHLKRRDLLWNWLPSLAHAVYFFHPIVWLAARGWRLAHEVACDEMLLARTQTRIVDCGGLLVKVSSLVRRDCRTNLAAAGVSGSYRTLSRRLHAMKSFGENSRGQLLVAALAVALLSIVGILPWRLVAQERPQGVDEAPPRANQLAAVDVQRIAGIAVLLELTEQEIGDLTKMVQRQRLPALDVPVAENLEARGGPDSVAERAGLSSSERSTLDKLLAREDVKNWESLQQLNQEGKLGDQEKSVVAKLAALGDRETRMREGVKEFLDSGTASDREIKILNRLERLMARRSMESLLFLVRVTFDPTIGGKASWTAVSRRDTDREDPDYMAFMRCPVGDRFPVRFEGEEDIRFWAKLLDGTDDRLRFEIRDHENDRRELTLRRDEPERFEVAGRAYSLYFPSTDVSGSQPQATGEAFIIVNHYPTKQTN